MMFHEVRELPKLKRNGYSLGHEVAVEKCATLIKEHAMLHSSTVV